MKTMQSILIMYFMISISAMGAEQPLGPAEVNCLL